MGGLFARVVLVSACLGVVAVLGPVFGSSQQVSRASQVSTAVGVDADPTGNSASSLGEIDACVSVAAGETFDVDIFVTDVADLNCWQATFTYDASVIEVVEADAEVFLAAQEESSVVDLSGPLPVEGAYLLIAADMRGAAESGSGVLARATLHALGPGSTVLAIYEVIMGDPESTPIGDVDGDSFFDGPVAYAQVWVDEPCPSPLPTLTPVLPPTPSPEAMPASPAAASPTPATVEPASPVAATPGGSPAVDMPTEGEDDGGFPWVVAVGASAAAVVAAIAAGLAFRWLRRGAS